MKRIVITIAVVLLIFLGVSGYLFYRVASNIETLPPGVSQQPTTDFIDIGGGTPSTSTSSGQVTVKPTVGPILTPEQLDRVIEFSEPVGDEAAYKLAETDTYRLWFSGIDRSFLIYYKTANVDATIRTEIDSLLAALLNVKVEEVCNYRVRVKTQPSPFGYEEGVIHACPRK